MTDRIFEIGGAGLDSTDQQVRKLMDNLTNSQVPGYKSSSAVISGFPLELEQASQRLSSVKPQTEGSFYSDAPAALLKTGGKYDVALGTEGFFVIEGPWGEGYTRDGRFQLDKDGRLLTLAGNYPVLGQAGPLVVTPGADIEFSQDGEVRVDGALVDRIRVVQPEQKNTLESLNGSIFKQSGNNAVMTDVSNPRVIQGYVEASNVNVVDQYMEMINLERMYSLNAKIVSTRDANLTKAQSLAGPAQ
jgi:flagellar basal-body rod protein FlgF